MNICPFLGGECFNISEHLPLFRGHNCGSNKRIDYTKEFIQAYSLKLAILTRREKKTMKAKTELKRKEKEAISKIHTSMLSQISDSEKTIKEKGYPFYYLQMFNQLNLNNIISDKEFNQYADLLLIMEILRLFNNKSDKTQNNNFEYCNDANFVDTSNLTIGMVVKDYATLCHLLGEETKTGGAKNTQTKNWKRYFDFEKIKCSNSIIIIDIYDEPISAAERKYRSSLYVNELKVLILKLLSNQSVNNKGNIIYRTSFSRLMKDLNILNKFFYCDLSEVIDFFSTKYNELLNNNNIKWNYEQFKNNAFQKAEDNIKYALKSLREDNMFEYSGYYTIGEKSTNSKSGIIFRKATPDEEADISEAKKLIANKLGYKNSRLATLFNNGKYNFCLSAYYKKEYGWDKVFYSLEIKAKARNIQRHISEYTALQDEHSVFDLSATELNEYIVRCNNNLSLSLKKQADSMQETKKESYCKSLQEKIPDYKDLDISTISSIEKVDEEPFIQKWGGDFPTIQKILIDYLVAFDSDKAKELQLFIQELHNKRKSQNDDDTIFDDFPF